VEQVASDRLALREEPVVKAVPLVPTIPTETLVTAEILELAQQKYQ